MGYGLFDREVVLLQNFNDRSRTVHLGNPLSLSDFGDEHHTDGHGMAVGD